jgi:hypothetical protein
LEPVKDDTLLLINMTKKQVPMYSKVFRIVAADEGRFRLESVYGGGFVYMNSQTTNSEKRHIASLDPYENNGTKFRRIAVQGEGVADGWEYFSYKPHSNMELIPYVLGVKWVKNSQAFGRVEQMYQIATNEATRERAKDVVVAGSKNITDKYHHGSMLLRMNRHNIA